jgi:hypothetical protein
MERMAIIKDSEGNTVRLMSQQPDKQAPCNGHM